MMSSGGLQGLRVLAQTLLELPAASAICCQSSRASAAYHSSAVGILAISQSRRHLSSMPQTTCSNSALASTSAYAAFSTSTTGHAAQEQQCQSATSAPGESCARTATLLEVANALHGLSSRVARLGVLTSLAASSRDLCVVMENIALRTHPRGRVSMPVLASPEQRRIALELPVAEAAPERSVVDQASDAAGTSGQDRDGTAAAGAVPPPYGSKQGGPLSAWDVLGAVLPLPDVSLLDDSKAVDGSPAPSAVRLDADYMDKITCWPALQPNHMESSFSLQSAIKLFPPQEAVYPTFVDFHAVMRKLDRHRSGKRMKLLKRLRRRQDKYQLKTWQHYPGEG